VHYKPLFEKYKPSKSDVYRFDISKITDFGAEFP
jgi:hypothetical protein